MFLWRIPDSMDFDPNGQKWQCCCCQLPTGLQALGATEMLITTAIAVGTAVHIAGDSQPPSVFVVCLMTLMAGMALTSALLIYGIQKHKPRFMYPSIFMRGVLIVFIQVFGVSTVVSPHTEHVKPTDWLEHGTPPPPATSVALRLVLLVFAMLFLTVLIVYICYLIVRGTNYEKAFARRKARRDSLITAGMIDPDFGSRRASNA